jgi:hypothetical protein
VCERSEQVARGARAWSTTVDDTDHSVARTAVARLPDSPPRWRLAAHVGAGVTVGWAARRPRGRRSRRQGLRGVARGGDMEARPRGGREGSLGGSSPYNRDLRDRKTLSPTSHAALDGACGANSQLASRGGLGSGSAEHRYRIGPRCVDPPGRCFLRFNARRGRNERTLAWTRKPLLRGKTCWTWWSMGDRTRSRVRIATIVH